MLTKQWRRWMRRNASGRRAVGLRLRVEALEGRDVPSSVMYGGSVTATSQTYNHPTAAGTALSGQTVPFQAMAFRVNLDDTYTLTDSSNTFSAPGAGAGFFALYKSGFNPASPLTNLVQTNGNALPQITQELVPGSTYFLVTSPAMSGSTGNFIAQISNPNISTYSFFTNSMPAVDNPILTNVSGTGATLGGVVEGTGNSAVTATGVVYSVNGANSMPTIGGAGVTNVVIGSGTGSFMTNVTGLALGTTYAFRAYATNAVGTYYTSPMTFIANTPPTIGGLVSTPQNINDTGSVQPFVLATVTDPDSPPQTETATVIYTAANGTFTGLGGFTGSAGDYTMTGSVAAVQAALRALTFMPTPHQATPGKTITTNFTVSVNDGFATATNSLTTVVAMGTTPTSPAVTVGSVQINDGSVQRSEVDSLTVTFSGPVTFAGGAGNAAAAFQLLHDTDNQLVALTAVASINSQGETVVKLSFSGADTDSESADNGGTLSLADGQYTLTILSASVTGTANGLALNGGGSNGNYVSPTDTQGGGPGELHLFRLFGDANGDGVVDQVDLGTFRSAFNASSGDPSYLAYLDADNSGTIDQTDLGQFRERFNSSVF